MNTGTKMLALAALTTLSLSALASTSAFASGWGTPGYGGHQNGYFGQDYPRRIWNPPHHHTPVANPCECEAPVRPTYVPVHVPVQVKVPVYVPVQVKVPVYVPVQVKVPVYVPVRVPVKVPVYVPVKAADPCNCETPIARQTYMPAPQPTYTPAPEPTYMPAPEPTYTPAPQQTATDPCDCEDPQYQTQAPQLPQTHQGHQGNAPQFDQTRRPANYASNQLEKK